MVSNLSAGQFRVWFAIFLTCLCLGTVFYGQALWFIVPVIAGRGCVSGGLCGPMAAVLGLWLKPVLMIAAALVGTVAFARRGQAIGSRWWGAVPLALMLPSMPSLFMLDGVLGTGVFTGVLYFPRWSVWDLAPLVALGGLFCLRVEHMPGFGGSIIRTRLLGWIPVGAIYVATGLWISSDLLLALAPHAGVAVSQATQVRDLLHVPVSVIDGAAMVGLPPHGAPPELVVSIATLANLAAFLSLLLVLAIDGSGRTRRARALAQIQYLDNTSESRPLFGSRRGQTG